MMIQKHHILMLHVAWRPLASVWAATDVSDQAATEGTATSCTCATTRQKAMRILTACSPSKKAHGDAVEPDFRKFSKELTGNMGQAGLNEVSKFLAATVPEKEGILKLFGKHSVTFFEEHIDGKQDHEEAEEKLTEVAVAFTPLHQAAHDGDVDTLRELLNADATSGVNKPNFWGLTPLHYAARGRLTLLRCCGISTQTSTQ